MSPSSRLARIGPGRSTLSSPIPRAPSSPGNDSTFFWLPTTAFLVVVAVLHWVLILVSTLNPAAAFPLAHTPPATVHIVSPLLPRMVAILPAVALLYFLDRRFGLVGERGAFARAAVAVVVAATLEWGVFLAGVALVDRCLGTDTMALVPGNLFGIAYRALVLGVGMLLFALGSQWRRMKSLHLRAAEAEAALRTSELARLEAQLQPHFLFNALTAVLACRHDPEAVASVTIGLSEHLRSCLSRQGVLEPLGCEIDALGHYLAVQRARFGRRLDCRITCTAEVREVLVPPVILEPLLDNALKHGAVTSSVPLRIAIDCRMEGTALVVTVDNSGTWIEPGADGRHGTGLANLRKRLELLDVRDATLESGPVAGGGVRARLRLPAVSQSPDAMTTAAASTSRGQR